MDPVQTYLSYLAAAPDIVRPPLTLAVDLAALALALTNAQARRFAPAGARRLAWLAVLVAGLGPLLLSVGQWANAFWDVPASSWSVAASAALLFALLVLGAATGRLTRGGRRRFGRALVELLGLLIVATGLTGVSVPALASAGLVDSSIAGSLLAMTSVSWSVAFAGAIIVLAANASGGVASVVPAGRRVWLVLTALAYTLVVAGVTFVPGWLGLADLWAPYALAVHVADALALFVLAGSARHMLNRPAAAEYWGLSSRVPERARRRRMARTPRPAHIAPVVNSAKQSAQAPLLASTLRSAPIVPPGALAPFTPPALRRTMVYGQSASATVQSVPPPASHERAPLPAEKVPLAPPEAPSAAPEQTEPSNPLPAGERAATLSENRAPQLSLSPQFVEAILLLQTEMLRAGRRYAFSEMVEMFADVPPRQGTVVAQRLGRAGTQQQQQTPIEPLVLPPTADA